MHGAGFSEGEGKERTREDLQPCGIHKWCVQPMNVHDEIMCVHEPSLGMVVKDTVEQTIESYREVIPLIKMNWKTNLANWSEK